MTKDEIYQDIIWWEALRDAIEDDEKQEAMDTIDNVIKMIRREASTPAVRRDD
jgi:hypothetical protein